MLNKRNKKRNFRVFFKTASVLCLLLVIAAGFIIADYNTRCVGMGNGSMRMEISLKRDSVYLNILGRERTFEVPDEISKWTGRIWNVMSPSVRAACWLFDGGCDAAARIMKRDG